MKKLELLPDQHYGIDGVPVYELVRQYRESLGINKSRFATHNGLDHAEQYRFEAGKNKSLSQVIKQLEAIGLRVTISVTEHK